MSRALPGRRMDYDLLRAASMVGVVYLHCAAVALRSATGALWHFANLVSTLATAAVPLFFMLSGALLLRQEKTAELSHLFRRRLPKVLVPLLAWSLVVALAKLRLVGPVSAGNILLALPSTPATIPYWFLYALVPLYLISPLLKKMADGLSDAHWNYLLALWFGLTIGMKTLHYFLPVGSAPRTFFTLHWTLNLDFLEGYLGYFLLGARLARLKRLPSRRLLWGAAVAGYLVIALGTWWDYARTGVYDERFKNYLYLFTALFSTALFLLARSYWEGRDSNRALARCSALSFGVYLAHPLAIEFWEMVWKRLTGAPADGLPQHLLFFAAVLVSCLLGVFVLSSVKPLCWLFTGQSFSAACRESNLFSLRRPGRAGD